MAYYGSWEGHSQRRIERRGRVWLDGCWEPERKREVDVGEALCLTRPYH